MTVVDARGMRCPWPAIRTARAVRARQGDDVTVLADDPAAAAELEKLAVSLGAGFAVEASVDGPQYRLSFAP